MHTVKYALLDNDKVNVKIMYPEQSISFNSTQKVKTEEGLFNFLDASIESYEGKFFKFNAATQKTFIDNTIIEFNKGKK